MTENSSTYERSFLSISFHFLPIYCEAATGFSVPVALFPLLLLVDGSPLIALIFSLIKFKYWVRRSTAISEATYSCTSSFFSCLTCRETVLYTRRAILLDKRPTVWTVCSTGSSCAEMGAEEMRAKRDLSEYHSFYAQALKHSQESSSTSVSDLGK